MYTHCCAEMTRHLANQDIPIIYIPKFREYGLKILDGGTAFQEINYCPWCGCQLPPSLRDAWFDELDQLGIDETTSDVPPKYHSDAWWSPTQAELEP